MKGKIVVFDALHTQHETARAVVFEGGGDYVFTVKDNQQGLNNEVTGPGDLELNRRRLELRFISACEPTDPEQAGFPSARQAASLTRLILREDKTSKETVHLITNLEASRASGKDLKTIKRDYWGSESKLHYRLDNLLDEDRSRVRNPNAALVLGMFRRVVVSFAIPWSEEKIRPKNRTSTRSFLEHLNADNRRRVFELVTSKSPSAWNQP